MAMMVKGWIGIRRCDLYLLKTWAVDDIRSFPTTPSELDGPEIGKLYVFKYDYPPEWDLAVHHGKSRLKFVIAKNDYAQRGKILDDVFSKCVNVLVATDDAVAGVEVWTNGNVFVWLTDNSAADRIKTWLDESFDLDRKIWLKPHSPPPTDLMDTCREHLAEAVAYVRHVRGMIYVGGPDQHHSWNTVLHLLHRLLTIYSVPKHEVLSVKLPTRYNGPSLFERAHQPYFMLLKSFKVIYDALRGASLKGFIPYNTRSKFEGCMNDVLWHAVDDAFWTVEHSNRLIHTGSNVKDLHNHRVQAARYALRCLIYNLDSSVRVNGIRVITGWGKSGKGSSKIRDSCLEDAKAHPNMHSCEDRLGSFYIKKAV